MRRVLIISLLIACCIMRVSAQEIVAPTVPDSAADIMPDNTETFQDGVMTIIRDLLPILRPDLTQAIHTGTKLIGIAMVISLLAAFQENSIQMILGITAVSAIFGIMLSGSISMISLSVETISEMREYGKLLFPVLTTALAAQGGAATAASVCSATMIFISLLGALMEAFLVPSVYLYLALAAVGAITGDSILTKMKNYIKRASEWLLKIVLSLFTGYLTLTRAISGATDAAALKMTKTVISTAVPVVGGILSEASETVLAGAGMIRNSVGIYGVLAIISIFSRPFIKVAVHYVILKLSGAISDIFSTKIVSDIILDFSSALGILLGMVGAMCVLLLIGCICFIKGSA